MSESPMREKANGAEPLPFRSRVEGEIVRIERAAVGMVQAERVEMQAAGAGVVIASKDVTIQGGGARDIIAGGAVRVTGGGAGALISLGPTDVQNGLVVLALTPKLQVGQGGRVLIGPTAIAAVVIVLAAIRAVLARRR